MKNQVKIFLLACSSLSLMGNQSCQSKSESRLLRMDAEIGVIRTLPLKVEDQEEIVIDQLNREMLARTIYNHNHFTINTSENSGLTNRAALNNSVSTENASTSLESLSSFSDNDQKLLQSYGFLAQNQSATQSLNLSGEVPRCQWEKPQLTLNSDVLGFELVNRTGLGVGYSPTGTHLDQMNGKIKFVNFRLDYGLTAIHPLLQRTVAATEAVTYKSSVEVIFDFGQNAPITIDFFYQEALVKVIRQAMVKALDRLVERLQEQTTGAGKNWNADVWESRVLFDPQICESDECVAIRGGSLNRIKIGDRFKATNMIHSWEGEPCQSKLLRSIPNPSTTQEIVIESVGDAVSIGRLVSNQGIAVEPGAQVKVSALNEPKVK